MSRLLYRGNGSVRMFSLLIIMTGFLILSICLAAKAFKAYEGGILDICATQQDSYVKLVVSQINLKENRDDQEMISRILGTLDQSSGRYWILSKDQQMLFVKDTLETNRYKQLTAGSYYGDGDAGDFFEGLDSGQAAHARIMLGQKEYIASGMLFENGGETYKVCLMTNTDVILDDNEFLGAKSMLLALMGIIYAIIFVLPLSMATAWNKKTALYEEMDNNIKKMRLRIDKMNARLSLEDIYDNRKNIFQLYMLPMFIKEYKTRSDAFPVSFLAYRYKEGSTAADFFIKNGVLLGKRDIKFCDNSLRLALILAISCDKDKAQILLPAVARDADSLGCFTAYYPGDIDSSLHNALKAMGNPDFSSNKLPSTKPDNRTESRYRKKESEKEEKMMPADTKHLKIGRKASAGDVPQSPPDGLKEIDERLKKLEDLVSGSSGELSLSDIRFRQLEAKLMELNELERRIDWLETRAGISADVPADPDYSDDGYCDIKPEPEPKKGMVIRRKNANA